ncbi:hypothetical protein CGCSCA4_v000029 [Colletotrichum siamense]|uniref:Zonadhesin n=1 Tax=Colletotrichum siamense TaxID=690259 RepID=A0A9P5K796_COLSI|nr:hypothetical protein CGCSCA4_v000029 [Colletotrichum siamense]KAF4861947.1 hypothetical protein CGCSCA2_v003847 [Colletotrichum siamense]
MHQPPPADQSTFDSQARYNLQATEDVDDEQHFVEEEKKRTIQLPKRPNYKPKPLRWPFITVVILLLGILMALVIVARTTMPNSDSTATIEPRHILMYRQNGTSDGQSTSTDPPPSTSPAETNSTPATSSSTATAVPSTSTVANLPISTGPDLPTSSGSQTQATSEQPLRASESSTLPSRSILEVSSPEVSSEKHEVVSTSDHAVVATDQPTITVIPESSPSDETVRASSKNPSTTAAPEPTDSTSLSSKTMVETTSTASETQTTSSINSKDSIVSTGPESSSTTAKTGTTSSSDNESKSASSTKSERSADATSSSTGRRGKEGPAITDTTSGSEITSFTSSTSRGRFKLPVITSEFTTTITKPGSTTTYTNEVTIHVPSTFTSTGKTTIPGTQGVTTYTDVRTTSVPRTVTRSGVTSFAHVTIIPVKPTITSIQTINHEPTVSEVVETSFEPTEITYTSTSAFTVPPRTSDVTSVIVSAVPSTVASVVTSTSPPQVYVSVGTTEITKFITVPGGNRGNEPQTQPPVFQVITSVYDGKVETFVDKGTPQTMVKSDGGVYTVAFTPPPQTIVTHEGGQATQMVITVTPSPEVAFVAVPTTKDGTPTVVVVPSTINPAGAGAFKEMATTINGKATVVNVPVTQEPVLLAVQTIIDGTPTVLWINSVPTAGFSPISLTLVSETGGITGVFTTIDPLETTKTTIDGKETTITRTPGPRTFTSVSGGTLTTMTIVTTPTGTMALSFTVITTIGGTLSTIISTPTPTTFTTSVSGTLRTITSTPSPTTRLSTIKPSTTLITSTTKPTATDSPDRVITEIEKFGFTNGDYFVGKFLPIILAVMIAVPLRIIDLSAKLYQPFHALAREGGSLGKSSMTLQFDGWKGFLTPFESLLQGHPVPFITTLIILCSSLLAPLATEAIGMKLHGTCKITAIDGCGIQLGVSPVSSYALVALIAFIVFLLLVLLFFLRTWETGLHANPWSIAGISSLARNSDIRSHQIDFKASAKAMREKRYGFGYFENNLGRDEYGIIYCDDSAQSLQGATASGAIPADDELTGTYQRDIAKKSRKPVPFIALTWWWRLGFIFFLTALFIIILYYHLTLGVRTSFKDFMDSQTFGVRFFFAALGVTIIFCWESIFISIAIISPYHNMGRRSQPPEKSILLTRPTNGFYGLYAAILEGNIILMLAAFMSILAEFLPILFANVPYNLTQTLKSHNVCATISLTILALMLASMVASLFIKWPELPVDPRSIAGALYYVAESRMLEDFEGLSKLDSEEREKKVKELGRRYFYGGLTGSNGKRMGVESVESVEDTAYTGGHWFLPPQEDQQGDEDNRGETVQDSEVPRQTERTLHSETRQGGNQEDDIDRGAVLPEPARPREAKQGSEGFR